MDTNRLLVRRVTLEPDWQILLPELWQRQRHRNVKLWADGVVGLNSQRGAIDALGHVLQGRKSDVNRAGAIGLDATIYWFCGEPGDDIGNAIGR